MSSEQEKRKYPRLINGIEVFDPNKILIGLTKNISLSGCFLKTDQDIKKDMLLTFQLPDSMGNVTTSCKVRWKNHKGVGLEFNLNNTNKLVFLRFFWITKTD